MDKLEYVHVGEFADVVYMDAIIIRIPKVMASKGFKMAIEFSKEISLFNDC